MYNKAINKGSFVVFFFAFLILWVLSHRNSLTFNIIHLRFGKFICKFCSFRFDFMENGNSILWFSCLLCCFFFSSLQHIDKYNRIFGENVLSQSHSHMIVYGFLYLYSNHKIEKFAFVRWHGTISIGRLFVCFFLL